MKRYANETIEKSEKRAKLKEDLWGDCDPNFDEFLIQASQRCDEIFAQPEVPKMTKQRVDNAKDADNALDQSELASFSACFAPNNVIASTQLENAFVRPQTPPKHAEDNIYEELKRLKEELEAKNGEVTILRSQLKQTKEQNEAESCRRVNESYTKINNFRKENEKICAELTFKDFEIANLKQKLANVTRNSNETANISKQINLSDGKIDLCEEFNVVPFSTCHYPLKELIPNSIFESNADDRFPRLERSERFSDKRYLHSLVFPDDEECYQKGVFTFVAVGETLKVKHCFEAIHALKHSTKSMIETDTRWIGDIFVKTFILLRNQLEHLSNLAKFIRKDEIEQCEWKKLDEEEWDLDCEYDLFQPGAYCKSLHNEEYAIQCRQCIAVLAVILPFNKYLQILLTNNQSNVAKSHVIQSDLLKNGSLSHEILKEHSFLKLLLKLVTIIEQTRKGTEFTGMLCAICELLRKIIQLKPQKVVILDLIANLVKELLFTKPTYPTLTHLNEFFKEASSNKEFIEKLCCMPSKCQIRKKYNEGLMIVNNQCCTFEIYSALCRKAVKRLTFREDVDDFSLYMNVLAFMTNIIGCNVKWLHLYTHDYNYFGCPLEYYKLTIDVLHAFLTKFKTRRRMHGDKNIPYSMKLIIKQCLYLLATVNNKFGELLDGKYNALLKSCQAYLHDCGFSECHKYAEETINKFGVSPLQNTINWEQLTSTRFQLSVKL